MKLSPEEVQVLFVYAARYTVGRATYAVGEMYDLIKSRWAEIPARTRSRLLQDLNIELGRERKLGHDCDHRQWVSLKKFMEENQ